jgi:hypothetical protein
MCVRIMSVCIVLSNYFKKTILELAPYKKLLLEVSLKKIYSGK